MLTLWGVVTALTVVGGLPAVGGLWMFERWRSRRRNRSGACAACGSAWGDTPSGDPFLIHGRLVCQHCALKAQQRMPWHFGFLALAAALATGGIAARKGFVAMVLLPAGTTVAMTLGAVQLMKMANRDAQRRIAAGEYAALAALGGDAAEGLALPRHPPGGNGRRRAEDG